MLARSDWNNGLGRESDLDPRPWHFRSDLNSGHPQTSPPTLLIGKISPQLSRDSDIIMSRPDFINPRWIAISLASRSFPPSFRAEICRGDRAMEGVSTVRS